MKFFYKIICVITFTFLLSACGNYVDESKPLVETIKIKLSSTELVSFESWLNKSDNNERISEALYLMSMQAYPNEDEELESINRYKERLFSYNKYLIPAQFPMLL